MTRYFKLGPYLASDPVVSISADFGKHGLRIEVACDDVPCRESDCTRDDEIRKMVDLLNRHWDDPTPLTTTHTCAINAKLAKDSL
jgi:hypothetical protein